MKKLIIILLASAVVLLVLFSYQSAEFSDNKMHVVICDIGQGDSIYIRTPGGADILVDGGPDSKVLNCLSRHMPLYDREIDLVFATHPDSDHVGGLISVLKSYKVDSFGTSTLDNKNNTATFSNLINEVKAQGVPLRVLVSGTRFSLADGVVLSTLWPKPGFSSPETNEYSLVQLLKYKDFDLLLTGDIPYSILDSLNIPDEKSIEVFKIPHHGSKTGVDDKTFQEIHADFVAISDGKNNPYHHPNPSVLNILKKYGVKYERTDQVGDIEVVTDGKLTKILN
ncbi:MAG TPA: MBL fold metallo-hydrolase [Patescibacteria group bacterium]|nr:MBL fold metallo-hydrolase [Patescibacteria group bacterium]